MEDNKKLTLTDKELKEIGTNPFIKDLKFTLEDEKNSIGIWNTNIYRKESFKETIFKLNNSIKLYWYLPFNLEENNEYVIVNKEHFMSTYSIKSLNTFKSMVNNLCKHNIIAKTIIKDVYWINPEFMFKGSRKEFYPNNLINE